MIYFSETFKLDTIIVLKGKKQSLERSLTYLINYNFQIVRSIKSVKWFILPENAAKYWLRYLSFDVIIWWSIDGGQVVSLTSSTTPFSCFVVTIECINNILKLLKYNWTLHYEQTTNIPRFNKKSDLLSSITNRLIQNMAIIPR